jgi:preprotein translocase subunit SecB
MNNKEDRMGELIFKGIKVEEIDLTNKLEGQAKLDISQRASFNVKYSSDNRHCAATLTIDMMEKDSPMDFNFKLQATAFLDCDGNMDKKEIHRKAYDEIYPHIRALVITILVNAGLPPIVIPKVRMDDSNIKVSEEADSKNKQYYS